MFVDSVISILLLLMEVIGRYKKLLFLQISVMEESLGGEQDLASGLQKKAKKLEDELVSAKRRTSQRKAQLAKLYKCYMQMNDYTERLKSTELELQTLVDSTLIESDMGDELVIRDGN
ncbi:hypothetical protein LINGRAHAP2_LOCUS21062 [Linum grandiflorum]